MADSLRIIANITNPVHSSDSSTVNWNLLTLIVAILTLIASVILPFLQKMYEERRAQFNFRMYIKEQFSYLYSLATYNKIDYIKPTISDHINKEAITFPEMTRRIRDDYKEHQNSVQPRIIFHFISNLQKYCHHIYQIRYSITKIDTRNLKEKIVGNGEKLSKRELKKLYGIILIADNFNSISLFHDRFGNVKSVEREIKNDIWVGVKQGKDLLNNQQLLLQDIKEVTNNESSLNELIGISGGLYNDLSSYYLTPESKSYFRHMFNNDKEKRT
jgi:hypothetical protein